MEKTRSLARSLSMGVTEENSSQSYQEDKNKDKDIVEQQMTEDEQLAYALQLSMDN